MSREAHEWFYIFSVKKGLGVDFGMSSTIKRALFHVFVGLSIPIAALFLPTMFLLVVFGSATGIFLAVDLVRPRASV